MPNAEHFFAQPIHYLIALVGEPGSGKTRAALSFPDCFVICCDPAGVEVLKDPRNAAFRSNLVWYDYFDSESEGELKTLFKKTDKPDDSGSIYSHLALARQMAKEGKIKTFILDGFSYYQDLLGAQIRQANPGSDEGNKWAYYKQLSNDLSLFVKSSVMTLATRYNLNVILTMHIQRQSEQQQEKQVSKDVDIAPRIEGGFRTAIGGIPRAMLYLDQQAKTETGADNKIIRSVAYRAFCQKVKVGGLGTIPAKNNYGLPPVIDLTDKSLYSIMQEAMTVNGEVKNAKVLPSQSPSISTQTVKK